MMFSIITAIYNRAFCIRECIRSVLEQTYRDWELIVIDDGSTDNTEKVLSEFMGQGNIIYTKLPKNMGINIARNVGIRKSHGQYITILDSDNLFFPTTLEIFHDILSKCKFYFIKTKVKTFSGRKLSKLDMDYFCSYKDFLCERLKGEYHTVVKKDLLLKYPFFEDIRGGEAITWKLIAKEVGGVYFYNIETLIYNDTLTDRLSIKKKNYKRLAKIFRKDLEVFGKDYLKYCPLRFAEKLLKFSVYKTLSLMKG